MGVYKGVRGVGSYPEMTSGSCVSTALWNSFMCVLLDRGSWTQVPGSLVEHVFKRKPPGVVANLQGVPRNPLLLVL